MKKIILISLLYILIHSLPAQENNHIIDVTYSLKKTRSLTEFLASDELEGRDTPSKGLEVAARYIVDAFNRYGLDPAPDLGNYFQTVKMISKDQPDQIRIKLGGKVITSEGAIFLISGRRAFTAGSWERIVSVTQDIEKLDLKNKIIVFTVDTDPGLNPRQVLDQSRKIQEIAHEKGASGLIEVLSGDHPLWNRFKRYFDRTSINLDVTEVDNPDLTHIVLRDTEGMFISGTGRSKSEEISIEIRGQNEKEFTTHNIIGMVEGTDPELKREFIICGAHYDHVGIGRPDATGDSIYNGARDNAVGVMSVMLAAENIARYPVKRSVLFVLFTGEEKGVMGSNWFVEHTPVPLKNIVFCLNADGGGYNDTTIATVIGKRRITAGHLFEKSCETFGLTAFEGTDNTQFLFNSSDNIIFSRKGVPSVTFSMGFREMDAEIFKHYHQPSDEAESLDFNYIQKFSKSFGMTIRMIADSNERMFWREDDEYYVAGMELYKN